MAQEHHYFHLQPQNTRNAQPPNNRVKNTRCHTGFIARNVKCIKVLNKTKAMLQPKMEKLTKVATAP